MKKLPEPIRITLALLWIGAILIVGIPYFILRKTIPILFQTIRALRIGADRLYWRHKRYREWENDVPETVKLLPVWVRRTWRVTKKLLFAAFMAFCLTMR